MSYKARIRFANREWLVVDNLSYQGKKYFYIVEDISNELSDLDNIENYQDKISVEFIYKLENGNYANVTDENLLVELSSLVALRNITKQ